MRKKWIAPSLVFIFLATFNVISQAQTAPGNDALTITPALTRSLIANIRKALYENYIFPDTALKMAAYLETQYKKGAYSDIKDPDQLADRLNRDLQKAHHDGHLRLGYEPGFARRLMDTAGDAEHRKMEDSMELADLKERNFLFTRAEILSGNIGYIAFNGFAGFIKEAKPTFTAAFRFVANAKALIIDLRYNGGGSPEMVNQVESYFFSEKTHLNDIVYRTANKKIDFWTDPEKADGVILRMPVYILTSRITFSGAEDFTYGLQSIKRAVVVGDTTGGGAHPERPFNIGSGFIAAIPFARSLNPYTNTDWEGTGIIPDIPVNSDKALEAAQKAIFMRLLKDAETEQEKAKWQWQLNKIKAMQSEEAPDSAVLARYTGIYRGGLDFYVSGHDLYCRNPERGNAVFKMRHIAGDQFILDENVNVEFRKDGSGNVDGIRMLWSDGGESFRPRDNKHG